MKPPDEEKLHEFVGRVLVGLGGAASVPLVRIGDKAGLYKSLHEAGPATSTKLTAPTG